MKCQSFATLFNPPEFMFYEDGSFVVKSLTLGQGVNTTPLYFRRALADLGVFIVGVRLSSR